MSACGSDPHHAGKTSRDGERSKGDREKTEVCEEVIANDTEAMTGVRSSPGVRMKSVVEIQRPTNKHAQVPVHTSVQGRVGVRLKHPRWRQLPLQREVN